MASAAQTSLKAIFQSMVPNGGGIIQGTVIKESPLQISLANDDKLTLTENNTVVPRELTNYEVEMDMNIEFYGRRKVKVYNALKKGEKVHILALQNGKGYFILGRA